MIIFWMLCAVMVIAALLYILWPLIKPSRVDDADELHAKITAYKANLYELEQDVVNGNMAAEDVATAREEIELAILQTAEQLEEKQSIDHQANLLPVLLIGALLPIAAIVTYLQLGQHQLVNGGTPATPPSAQAPASVEEMVAGLAEKMKHQPNDVTGWTMLARSYMVMGRYDDALGAYEHLYSIASDNPSVLVGYADAISMSNQGNLLGKPEELLEKALQLEPLNTAGLWLSGMAAQQLGNDEAAINFWQKLIPQIQDDEKALQQIETLIAQSQARLGVATQVIEKEVAEPVVEKRAVKVGVTLSDEVKSSVDLTSTVFVVARALSGSPVPLAVVRKQVSDIPFEIVLDDSAAMAPIAKISDHEKVNVSARISLTGNAIRQPGDISSEWISVDTNGTEVVTLNIGQILE